MSQQQSRTIIEKLNDAWNSAFNSGDVAALVALYGENARLSPGNGAVLNGRSEIRDLFNSFIDNGVHGHTIDIITTGGDGDVVHEMAKWSAVGPEKDGAAQRLGGVLVHVFSRDDAGNWKSQLHLWN